MIASVTCSLHAVQIKCHTVSQKVVHSGCAVCLAKYKVFVTSGSVSQPYNRWSSLGRLLLQARSQLPWMV